MLSRWRVITTSDKLDIFSHERRNTRATITGDSRRLVFFIMCSSEAKSGDITQKTALWLCFFLQEGSSLVIREDVAGRVSVVRCMHCRRIIGDLEVFYSCASCVHDVSHLCVSCHGLCGSHKPGHRMERDVAMAAVRPELRTSTARTMSHALERFGGRPCLGTRSSSGVFSWTTYNQVRERAHDLAEGFCSLGVTKGSTVGLCSPNRPEWAVIELALLFRGIVLVPMPHDDVETCRDILHSAHCAVVVCAEGRGVPKKKCRLLDCGKEVCVLTGKVFACKSRPYFVTCIECTDAVLARKNVGDDPCCTVKHSGDATRAVR